MKRITSCVDGILDNPYSIASSLRLVTKICKFGSRSNPDSVWQICSSCPSWLWDSSRALIMMYISSLGATKDLNISMNTDIDPPATDFPSRQSLCKSCIRNFGTAGRQVAQFMDRRKLIADCFSVSLKVK